MEKEESYDFYKSFYDKNRVRVLQYENLRECFQKMIGDILGKDYYNMGMDVYDCDRLSCEDVTAKSRRWWELWDM